MGSPDAHCTYQNRMKWLLIAVIGLLVVELVATPSEYLVGSISLERSIFAFAIKAALIAIGLYLLRKVYK